MYDPVDGSAEAQRERASQLAQEQLAHSPAHPPISPSLPPPSAAEVASAIATIASRGHEPATTYVSLAEYDRLYGTSLAADVAALRSQVGPLFCESSGFSTEYAATYAPPLSSAPPSLAGLSPSTIILDDAPPLSPGEALLDDLRIPSRNDPAPEVSWHLPPTPPKRRKAAFSLRNRLFAPGPVLSLSEALLLLAWWISLSVVFFYLAVG